MGGGGIQVFDLSGIDSGVVSLVNTVTTGGRSRTHNVAVDETSGFLDRLSGGPETVAPQDVEDSVVSLRIYDLSKPAAPEFVGEWIGNDRHARLVHDAQVVSYTDGPFAGRQIAFCFTNGIELPRSSDGCDGSLDLLSPGVDILDVTEKSNITELGFNEHSFGSISHQGWLSDDRTYLYVNDEGAERDFQLPTTTRVIDVSDLTLPFEAATFTNDNAATDHNLYVVGHRLFASNYASGLRIFDTTDPLAPMEVAFFDTVPTGDDVGCCDGLWSTYPFFASGIIIGSDTVSGLFVWSLEGAGDTPDPEPP